MAEEKKIEGFSNIKFTASGLLLEAKFENRCTAEDYPCSYRYGVFR